MPPHADPQSATGTRHAATQPSPASAQRALYPRPTAEMGQGGLEPPTPRLSSVCSNQLSYWPSSPGNTPGLKAGPSAQPRPEHATGEGCADGADPDRTRHASAAPPRWPAGLARGDGESIGMCQAPSPSHPGPASASNALRAMCSHCSGSAAAEDRSPSPHTRILERR